MFAGWSIPELACLAQSAPLYAYSRQAISKKIKLTRESLPSSVRLHYSIKANPHPLTVAHVARQVDGLDVASHSEMLVALGTGHRPENISFSGPGKSTNELTAAIVAGIVIHVESVKEIERILSISTYLNKKPLIALRINPDFKVKQSGMVMGGGSQPFGIDLDQIDTAINLLRNADTDCVGLHCYAGSQMLNAELVCELQKQTIEMMMNLVQRHDLKNVSLNLGGGFGVPYFVHEKPLDVNHVGHNLASQITQYGRSDHISSIIIELGRFLVAESGVYIAQVVEKKISRGKQFLVVQGGMNHHLAASGNLGQTIRRNFPIVGCPSTKRNIVDSNLETVSVVGPLCTPLDILASDVELPELQPGEHIAILNSGAYGYSASPHLFLSHPQPIEILL